MLKSPLEIMREMYDESCWLESSDEGGEWCKFCDAPSTFIPRPLPHTSCDWRDQLAFDHTPSCLLRHIRVHLMREAIHGL